MGFLNPYNTWRCISEISILLENNRLEGEIRPSAILVLLKFPLEYAWIVSDPAVNSYVSLVENAKQKTVNFVKNCYEESVSNKRVYKVLQN